MAKNAPLHIKSPVKNFYGRAKGGGGDRTVPPPLNTPLVLALNLLYHQLLFSMGSCLLHVTSSVNNEKIKIKNE